MTLWAAPKGVSRGDEQSTGSEQAFLEIARFVMVKAKSSHSLCLRISTYGGQGTTNSGLNPAEHAAVVPEGGTVELHPAENLVHGAIEVKIEGEDVGVDPMSRINFAKIYTIEHNIRVRNVGRVTAISLSEIETQFLKALGIPPPRPAPEPVPTGLEADSCLSSSKLLLRPPPQPYPSGPEMDDVSTLDTPRSISPTKPSVATNQDTICQSADPTPRAGPEPLANNDGN
jgi:hypothetical protein